MDAISERLEACGEVLFALAFGSRVDGTPRPDSDWDIAVFLSPALGDKERWEVRLRLQADLAELGAVDLVVLNDVPPLLAHRALRGERLLVRDRSAYVRFFVGTMARAGDERFYRDLHAAARRRRLKEDRFGRP